MMMKIGNDIVEVKRFFELVSNKRFLERVFTESEQKHIMQAKDKQKQAERMAGKFAAKEAVAKALGFGICDGVEWCKIEILPNELGAPVVTLYENTKEVFSKLQASQIEVSISNTTTFATAVCIIF